MGSNYAIVVLANNMKFFKLMAQNFPSDINDYLLIVVNEQRIGDKTEQIEEILQESICNNYKIFGSELILKKFKEEVIDNAFVDSYTMSMNILSLWFVYRFNKRIEKVLLLDDDVILRDGLADLFRNNKNVFKYNRLSAGMSDFFAQSLNAQEILFEWFKIFDIDFTLEWWQGVYLKKYANSGQRLIVKTMFDLQEYEKKLKQFFESEIFEFAWNERRRHTSWYFDERFETFFFMETLNDDMKKYAVLVLSRPEKLKENYYRRLKETTIIHNATNSHKKDLYNEMIERGIIRGDKI